MALLATRLRLDWGAGQLVVSRAGRPPATEVVDPKATEASATRPNQYQERIEALEEIARLLSTELSRSDVRQAAEVAELHRQLARLQADVQQLARQTNARWQVADQDIRDLHYLTQFSPDSNPKGTLP